MQPFALAGAERKPLALRGLVLGRLALKASALKALAQEQPRLREDETWGKETRQRLEVTDRAHGSELLPADRRA